MTRGNLFRKLLLCIANILHTEEVLEDGKKSDIENLFAADYYDQASINEATDILLQVLPSSNHYKACLDKIKELIDYLDEDISAYQFYKYDTVATHRQTLFKAFAQNGEGACCVCSELLYYNSERGYSEKEWKAIELLLAYDGGLVLVR